MIPESLSPPTRNRSHAITAEVNIQEGGAEGVLIAQGGLFGGYVLYIQNNRLIYDHNFLGITHHVITSEVEIPTGPATLGFEFTKTGEHEGIGKLFFNKQQVGEGSIPRTVPVRYSLSEGLEIGRDTATPVSKNYNCPFEFTGILKKVEVEVYGEPHHDPEGDFNVALGRQ